MRTKELRERSVSGDFDDSDFESHNGESSLPGKPGRKKNPNSQAARRDQNRIAQREFRLRKQQRIRDLEARVEILSGGKDEALSEMRNMLRDLMAENQTLRNLLRSLGGFIGDGAGGLLPKLGWDMADFNNFINRSETDTAWEGYQKRKKQQQTSESSSSAIQGQKRPAGEQSMSNHVKKARNGDSEERGQNGYPVLVSVDATLPANNMYPGNSRSEERSGMFADLLRTSGSSPVFVQQHTVSNTPPSYSETNVGSFQSAYMPGVNLDSSIPPVSYNPASTSTVSTQQQQDDGEPLEDDDPNKQEAYKLINYHLQNFKRNGQYCLPSSLRPTVVQRTIPHESVIDAILHAELRDRMILLRNRYDLVECLMDYKKAVTVHGDDVLSQTNWEIGETFLRKYGFLIDKATLATANRWRRERGEPELRLSDIGSSDQPPLS